MNKEQLSRHDYISLRLTKGSLDAINRMRSELSKRPDLMDPRRINTTTVINFMLENYVMMERPIEIRCDLSERTKEALKKALSERALLIPMDIDVDRPDEVIE